MKQAIYIEQKNKKTGNIDGWVGYLYATTAKKELEFVKKTIDQWGNEVNIYRTDNEQGLETPAGVEKSNFVALYENYTFDGKKHATVN